MASGVVQGDALRYDAFLTYADEDREWVEKLVDHLEAAPYNMKCVNHYRDYHPGKTEWENNQFFLDASDAFLVVLTPSFVDSKWNTYDLDQILAHSMRADRSTIIPLIKEPCRVPSSLNHLIPIKASASFTESWFHKLLSTLGYTRCQGCLSDEQVRASHWCNTCNMTICNQCRHLHTEQDEHQVVDVRDHLSNSLKRSTLLCIEHGRAIEMYCTSCQVSLCHTCQVVNHRTCDDIVTVSDGKALIEENLARKQATIEQNLQRVSLEETRLSQALIDLNRHVGSRRDYIAEEFDRQRKILKEKEATFMAEIESKFHSNEAELKDRIVSTTELVRQSKEHLLLISNALKSKSEIEMCETDMNVKPQAIQVTSEEEINSLSGANINLPEMNIALTSTLESPAADSPDDARPEMNDKAVLEKIIHAEGGKHSMHDMCLITDNDKIIIVVTDPVNRTLRSFYQHGMKMSSNAKFIGDAPRGVTSVGDQTVAVSVPDTKSILFFKVTPGIELVRVLDCNTVFNSLCFMKPNLFVGCFKDKDGPKLYYVSYEDDTSSIFLTALCVINKTKRLFDDPSYLCKSDDGLVIVSDAGKVKVICLDEDGCEVFQFPPLRDGTLQSPRGVAASTKGDVFIADHAQNAIIKVKADGQFVGQVLTSNDGVVGPCCVATDADGKLYVGLSNGVIQKYRLPSTN
ncbi:uncharacterized protein LOC124150679 [Haliotis rufescens]|uniref:uncharacterized protein LOC124150679 n=1 Tax=Haliotis rufescens TaxID=6454 RepID=UPI00201E986D|nr:uncharacterized protein LOC124150679 [Haliotis rufescens]